VHVSHTAKEGDWTTLPDALLFHAKVPIPGSLRLVKAGGGAPVGTTLPPADAQEIARLIADAGYEITVETRHHPTMPLRRWSTFRVGPRLEIELERATLQVQGDVELDAGVFVDAEIECAGHARLEAGAGVLGDLTAREASLGPSARVRGRVACQGALSLDARARVEGGADVRSLRLGAGSTVQGRVVARDAVILPHARREPEPRVSVLSDDARVEGVLVMAGPVLLRPGAREGVRVPVLDAEAPGTLRVLGDVRLARGCRVAFRIEAEGDIDVEDGCVALAPLVARGELRVHGQSRLVARASERRERIAHDAVAMPVQGPFDP